MNFQRSTRYALYSALEMAAAPRGGAVTAGQVSEKYRLPPTVVAKVFQRLVHSGIALGTRGVTGGYRLARPASEIALLEVVELFEGRRAEATCGSAELGEGSSARVADCRLRSLFAEIDQQARATFASVTLATLVAPRQPLLIPAPARRGS